MTPSTAPSESPQARLIASRKALIRQMVRGREDTGTDSSSDSDNSSYGQTDNARQGSGSSIWQVFTQAVKAWWQYHPMQVVVDIGRPFLSKYARDKPLQLLGIAAGAGAAAVLVKPWRLVSVTGLALALFKSPKLSDTLLSLLPRPSAKKYSRQAQQQTPKDAP